MKSSPLALGVTCAAALTGMTGPTFASPTTPLTRPNIVLIMADDLGWGDVGFQGQSRILTPHLDALAASGRVYSRAFCPAAVCGPTRAALLTGFHSGHTFVDRNQPDLNAGFRDEDVMISEVLRDSGYRTATFGKWGFETSPSDVLISPDSLPTNQGFDEFYGYLSHKAAHDYFNPQLWRNDPNAPSGVSPEPTGGVYTHDLIQAEVLSYIETTAGAIDPFFLYVGYTIPHFDLDAIALVPGWFDAYDDVPGASSWSSKQQKYAAMITRMDSSIGELIDHLRDPNQDGDTGDSVYEETLIIFTSDNGPTAEDNAPINLFDSNGPWRGGKRDLWDGGVRVPLVYSLPGKIAPSTTDLLTDLCDVFPTLTSLTGAQGSPGLDGVSLVPDLLGWPGQQIRGYLSFEHHESDGPDSDTRRARWAIRTEDWKLIAFSGGDLDLYDLTVDPAEFNDVSALHPDVVTELSARALLEKLTASGDYAVDYVDWIGGDADSLVNAASWSAQAIPNDGWSALVENDGLVPMTASLETGIASFPGLAISGPSAAQSLTVGPQAALSATNGVEVRHGGTLALDGGTIKSNRAIQIAPGGTFTGRGVINASVRNAARLEVVAVHESVSTETVNTGEVEAVAFDFTGTQNANPLLATSTLNPSVAVPGGLTWGPGLGEGAPATDVGDEFNLSGFETTGGASTALAAGDFIRFVLTPLPGVAMTLQEVSFTVWRNGANAATDYAVVVRPVGGAEQVWGTFFQDRSTAGAASAASVTGVASGEGLATKEAVEVFLTGWNGISSGNTHITAASARASFESSTSVPPSGLEVLGDLWLADTGTLALAALEGPTLTVAGTMTLNGRLEVTGNGLTLEPGDRFVLWQAGVTTGEFVAYTLPTLRNGLSWNTDALSSTGTLTVEATNAFFAWLDAASVPVPDWSYSFDGDRDGVSAAVEFLTGGSLTAFDAAPWDGDALPEDQFCFAFTVDRTDAITWVLQRSSNLIEWTDVPGEALSLSPGPPGTVRYCWTPVPPAKRIFVRFRFE